MTPADLKAWRKRMGYTQQEAAAALGMSAAGYQQLESGRNKGTGKQFAPDKRTALACAAIEAGLPPVGTDVSSDMSNIEARAVAWAADAAGDDHV